MFDQSEVKRFIASEVLGKLSFNEHQESGAHSTFIARAAKNSGLTVRKIREGHYFFDDQRAIGSVEAMVSSLISYPAVDICRSKHVMKELFISGGVPVPKGSAFNRAQRAAGLRYYQSLGSFVVVKPDKGHGGRGITAGINTADEFRDAWSKAAEHARGDVPIVVEEYVSGLDLRVYVIAGKVVAASTRVPPFVVGDGQSTIAALLEEKKAQRERSKYLRRLHIAVDTNWMANTGNYLEKVLSLGEVAVLSATSNLSQGGESVDVTNLLSEDLAAIAVSAIAAIPGMQAGGVDFQAQSPYTADGAVVLEVNAAANISVHHLPAYGRSIDVGQALINAMMFQLR